MIDWVTASSLATAGGTLVLAVATFAAVRSANHAARIAERAVQLGMRPLLMPSHLEDTAQKIMWSDGQWGTVQGGRAFTLATDEVVYLAISVRNAGRGIGVLHGWSPSAGLLLAAAPHAAPEDFRRHSRDLYVSPGDVSFWQGALRDADDPVRPTLAKAIAERQRFSVDVLYSDHDGGQRTISRFSFLHRDDLGWVSSVVRHWQLDNPDPRQAWPARGTPKRPGVMGSPERIGLCEGREIRWHEAHGRSPCFRCAQPGWRAG